MAEGRAEWLNGEHRTELLFKGEGARARVCVLGILLTWHQKSQGNEPKGFICSARHMINEQKQEVGFATTVTKRANKPVLSCIQQFWSCPPVRTSHDTGHTALTSPSPGHPKTALLQGVSVHNNREVKESSNKDIFGKSNMYVCMYVCMQLY